MKHVSFLVLLPALSSCNKEAAVLQDRVEPVGSPGSALRPTAHSAPGTDYTGRTSEPGQETLRGLTDPGLNLRFTWSYETVNFRLTVQISYAVTRVACRLQITWYWKGA